LTDQTPVDIDRANELEGISIVIYDGFQQVLDALYFTASAANALLKHFRLPVYMVLSSGVAVKLWNPELQEIPDFRWPKRRFAWFAMEIMGYPVVIKLTSNTIAGGSIISDAINNLASSTKIPGSENWEYKDVDGEIKVGTLCNPPRFYSWTTDLTNDIFPFAMIVAIVIILAKLGFFEWAKRFISWLWKSRYNRMIASTEDMVADVVKKVDDIGSRLVSVEDIVGQDSVQVKLDEVVSELEQHEAELEQIKALIGLRLTL